MITEGIHLDIPADVYHADPCPAPSLSSSVAQILIDKSPLHAWTAHPRLNPAYEPDESSRADLGSVAHKLVLGRGKEIAVIEADDWRTKAAKDARAVARAAGMIPCLAHQFADAEKMEEVARRSMAELLLDQFNTEAVLAWKEGPIWCRGMVDAVSADRRVIVDYKTTADASPGVFGRRLYDMGYHRQAAFYDRGLAKIDPEGRGRRKFFIVAQEIEPPYACSIHEIDAAGRLIAAKQMAWAISTWMWCIENDRWPGYEGVTRAEMPPWLEKSWLERELAMEAQRPLVEPIW